MPEIEQCNIRPPHLGFDCPCALSIALVEIKDLSKWDPKYWVLVMRIIRLSKYFK